MSQICVFAFVEGKDADAFFYGKLFQPICQTLGLSYEVRSARELPVGAGGKDSLLKYHDDLKAQGLLVSVYSGKKTVVVFCLDKDIDDILLRRRYSEHVIYTDFYDIENYLFRSAKIVDAFAAAASIDASVLMASGVIPPDWCKRMAILWQDWIVMCIFALAAKVGGFANYSVFSPFNRPLNGPVDPALLRSAEGNLRKTFAGTDAQFQRLVSKARRIAVRSIASENFDRVFKGKWYPTLAEIELRQAFPTSQHAGASKRIKSILLYGLDYSGSWSSRLRDAIQSVCKRAL